MATKNLKIIFFGTPVFATAVLEKLIAEEFDIAAVFTRSDKKIGRRQIMSRSPVKELAAKHKLEVFQPDTLRDRSAVSEIRGIKPDLIVVAAYGKILPKEILEIPRFGALNIHASLLPRYRGASPIQEALLHGDKETGVTIMLMDEGMDTGGILAQEKVKIEESDTAITLAEKLAACGAELLAKTVRGWVSGKIKPAKQDEKLASYCKIIKKEDGRINWKDSAQTIFRKWKAYQPWPGIFTSSQGQRLRLAEISFGAGKGVREKPGKVVEYNQHTAIVAGEGLVILEKVQLEGKKEASARDFLRGRRNFLGATLC